MDIYWRLSSSVADKKNGQVTRNLKMNIAVSVNCNQS